MRLATLESTLNTADANLSAALATYAEQRRKLQTPYKLYPGEFLDRDGATSPQFGLTATALWIALIDSSRRSGRIATFVKGCEEVVARARAGTVNEAEVKDLQWDYQNVLIKRCLCLLTVTTLVELEHEITFLFTHADGPVGHPTGWRARLRDVPKNDDDVDAEADQSDEAASEALEPAGATDHLITAYILMAIADAMQRMAIVAEGLTPKIRERLNFVLRAHKENVELPADGDAYNQPIHSLYYINCMYRMKKLGFLGDDLNDTRMRLRRLIARIYDGSALDAAYVGTEIIAFYNDVGKNRYFRFNVDAILLESYFFAYGENLAVFNTVRGELILTRIVANYAKSEFRIDSNGQRLTVYAAYHAFRALELLRKALKEQKAQTGLKRLSQWLRSGGAFFRAELDFSRAALPRLISSTATLVLVAAIAYLLAPNDYQRGFAYVFALASVAPAAEFVVTKLTERLTLGRMK